MSKSVSMGSNKTGMQMSPLDSLELLEQVDIQTEMPFGMPEATELRRQYIEEGFEIGSVPVPGTMKGIAKSGFDKLSGKNTELFMDKLGERMQFERTGTRLYDALILKCEAMGSNVIAVEDLKRIQQEEAEHFDMVRDTIIELGGDPTAQTPSADVDGVMSMGLIQVARDPRTSLAHTLHAIHIAELADNDGWAMLIELARELGKDHIVERFEQALLQEDEHLATVRLWMQEMMSEDATQSLQ